MKEIKKIKKPKKNTSQKPELSSSAKLKALEEADVIFEEADREVSSASFERTPTINTFITGMIKTSVYLTTIIVVSVFLAVGIILVGNDVFALVKSDEVVELTIPEEMSIEDTAKLLYENKIIKYPKIFTIFAGLKDVDTADFVAGTYSVSPSMNYERLCSVFIPRREREIIRLTIPEGATVMDIISIFTEAGIGTKEGFVDAINSFDYSEYFDFLPEVYSACTADRIYKLEGYLYPDTYDFYSDSKETQIIYKLLENFDAKFSGQMKKDAEAAGYTMDQIIILASLVQKEAYYYEDYDSIASVFINRLKNKSAFPKLESDATTVYAIELATGKRPEKLGDAELAFNSPYNTRVYNGLPPGAICNPGYEAIMCAIYPADTPYYYFVADKEKHNIFSKTYDEHKKAVAAVIRDSEDE
ncbi:MAG: endolytic transglycosylase MltG [Clostridia bacterium]|nr:endolytic transglycosylase MltG [Clostridia bacterium]